MKIIYNAMTNVLVSTLGDTHLPGPGELSAEVAFVSLTKPARYYKFNGVFIVPRSDKEVVAEIAAENFSFELLVGALFQKLSMARIKALGNQTANLQWLVTWKNWEGINAFIQLLVADGDATQDEAKAIKECFALQGINLDDYAQQP